MFSRPGTMETVRLGLFQVNTTVGDLVGNCAKIRAFARRAADAGVDIACFPELAVTGYPPEDLLLKQGFVSDAAAALASLAAEIGNVVAVVGCLDRDRTGRLYNAAALLARGRILGMYRKVLLPNYGVFDERRYFSPGRRPLIFAVGRALVGVTICEDIWRAGGPLAAEVSAGCGLIMNLSASPYDAAKPAARRDVIRTRCREAGVTLAYTNLVGGQDELVFDGRSIVVDPAGDVIAAAESFREAFLVADVDVTGTGPVLEIAVRAADAVHARRERVRPRPAPERGPVEDVYEALLTGLRDYVSKSGFREVVVGLSGGIDSALVTAIATDAIGAGRTHAVFMPSRFTSLESREDAAAVARLLEIDLVHLPIEDLQHGYLAALAGAFAGRTADVTEENLQARIRGNLLMALSNKFGWLVLTTGNKSELSMGYSTLYGDMAGGFAVIKDVFKTLVYELARWRNSRGEIIPERIFTKAPTAELRPGQKDTDSLPPYDLLDRILRRYVEEDAGLEEIAAGGFDRELVARVIRAVDRNEYKRRQAPPGIRITPKAFGKDRRMPIVNRYTS